MVCVGLPTKPVTLHDMTDDLIYREIQLTGVSGRLIWQTWEDFAKVMKGPYYKLDKVIGGCFALEDYEKALEEIRKGTPGKMLLFPNAEDISRLIGKGDWGKVVSIWEICYNKNISGFA